jgi:hypothetical protein
MSYIYQDKETMKPGVNVFSTCNKLSKDVVLKFGHLSVPLGLYENSNKIYTKLPNIGVLDNLEEENLIDAEKFNSLLDNSIVKLSSDRKTRKKVGKIIKIKTDSSRKKSKRRKEGIRKNKKSKKKRRGY